MSNNLFKDTDDPIEKKKNENADGGKKMNFKKFAITFFGNFLVTICFFTVVIGSFGLYTSKVAQSNILPINPDFAPYTDVDYGFNGDGDPAPVFMNIVKERGAKGLNFWDDPISTTAQQATFIKEDFNDNGIFKYLCEMKPFTEKNEYFSRMMFFFRKIFIGGVISSFGMINTIYSSLYSLPEWLLMLIYFTILPFIFIFLICWNAFNIFMEAVSNLTLPFRESNTKHNGNGISFDYIKPKENDPTSEWWRPWSICELDKYKKDNDGWFFGTITKIIDYTGNGLMFMIYAMVTFNIIIPISVIVTILGLINPLRRKYKLDKDIDENKLHGIGDFIRDTFVYKKTFIIFLAAYNLLMSTGIYLEAGYTFSCFVGILLLVLYFDVFVTPGAVDINANDITQQIYQNNEYSKTEQFEQTASGTFKPCESSKKNVEQGTEETETYKNKVYKKKTSLKKTMTNYSDDAKTNLADKIRPKTDTEIAAKIAAKIAANAADKIESDKKWAERKEKANNIGTSLLKVPGNIVDAVKSIPDKFNTGRTDLANKLLWSRTNQIAGTSLKRTKGGALYNKYNFSLI